MEEIIIDSSVNACTKNIIEKLKEKDNHYSVVPSLDGQPVSHLSSVILDLFDNSQEYGLSFSVEQLGYDSNGNEINATTSHSNSGNGWDIKIDSDLVNNGTQLFIAKSIIHEALHAFIKYTVNEEPSSEFVNDLQALFLEKNNNESLTHHEMMSQYIEALAFSLATWDNHQLGMDYYRKISWGGLESSDTYNQLPNKTEVQNAIKNERYGTNNAKGVKCN